MHGYPDGLASHPTHPAALLPPPKKPCGCPYIDLHVSRRVQSRRPALAALCRPLCQLQQAPPAPRTALVNWLENTHAPKDALNHPVSEDENHVPRAALMLAAKIHFAGACLVEPDLESLFDALELLRF
ncbi:hypothetical protein PTTG_25080 [Puccinia triticina 1-1 BBBD Race 1]|uniref:Uncharacterized protein n=1 Tax=Puccinia triticina (isolate 1-1 / race 1 (BBBD)) TaxID=630390 RepID=A0A180H4F3_PUCT1|nr:hypothetical protein PTTG_25080 [Puccinia triticina 1-1 BBBD Race 1]